MTEISCAACQRANLTHRRYCGGCGQNLAPVCQDCGFSNEGDDRYCGGCGTSMTPGVSPVTIARIPVVPSARSGAIDLVELFRAPETTSELPKIGIAQDDLDRLFGDAS